jgi:phage host-nuclease inhibitor protein Gam
MTTSATTSTLRIVAPSNLEGADRLVGIINIAQGRVDKLAAVAAEKIAKIKAELDAATATDEKTVSKCVEKLVSFAQAHRDLIVTVDGKTVDLTNGSLALRLGNVSVDCDNDDELIAELELLGLSGFVRTKKELDRDGLIADRELLPLIDGLSFIRKERLHIKPINAREITKQKTVRL